jgi:hypothetical protein
MSLNLTSAVLVAFKASPQGARGRPDPDPFWLILAGVCVFVVVVPLGMWFSSFVLRAAVGLTNRVLGGRRQTDLDYYSKENPFARYKGTPRLKSRAGLLIPEPTIGGGMVIVFLTTVVQVVVQFGIGVGTIHLTAPDGPYPLEPLETAILSAAVVFPTTFVVQSVMLAALLPTTFWRACAVQVAEWVIFLLMACVVVGAVAVWYHTRDVELLPANPDPAAAAPEVPPT